MQKPWMSSACASLFYAIFDDGFQQIQKTHLYNLANNYSPTSNISACRRCSNYIFIIHLTPGFNGCGKDNCKMRWETFKFGNLVRLILDILRLLLSILWLLCVTAYTTCQPPLICELDMWMGIVGCDSLGNWGLRALSVPNHCYVSKPYLRT